MENILLDGNNNVKSVKLRNGKTFYIKPYNNGFLGSKENLNTRIIDSFKCVYFKKANGFNSILDVENYAKNYLH